MKVIEVPSFFQETGSFDCLIVCVQMAMAFFGVPTELPRIKERMHYVPQVGTSLYENGSYLLENGFQTVAITAHPQLFPPEVIRECTGNGQEANPIRVLPYIARRIEQASSDRDRLVLETLEHYVKKGGTLKLEIPHFHHLKSAIDAGFPLIALLHAGAMGEKEGGLHGVLVSGYREREILINNPSEISLKRHWVSAESFFYGLYASTCLDFDNGSLLVVSPKH